MFLTREMTDLSYPQIAALYGGRDHSTVISSIDRVAGQPLGRSRGHDGCGHTPRYSPHTRIRETVEAPERLPQSVQPPQALSSIPLW